MNNFKYTNSNKRYHTLDYYYKNRFHEKVFKVSLNAGFSCPNIDGKVGYGGCIYCSKSGSGEFAGNKEDSLEKQFKEIKEMMLKKWPKAKYIGYFQARTNTYAPVNELKKMYETILKQDNVIGLNIATRPDSITDECLDYLEELNKAAQCHEDVQGKIKDFYELNKRNLLSMQNCYVIGAGPNFGTALEGALKFSETIQVVSVAYELEEFLHGPNFQLTPNYTLFFIDNEDETSDRLLDIYEGYSTVTDRCFIISNSERIQGDHVLRIDDLTCEDVSMLYKVVVFEYLAYKVTTDLNKWQYHPLAKVVEDTIIKIKSSKYKEGYDKL